MHMIKTLLFLIHGVFNTVSGRKENQEENIDISIGVNLISFPRNDEKFDF